MVPKMDEQLSLGRIVVILGGLFEEFDQQKVYPKSENGSQGLPNGKVSSGLAECAGPAGDYRGKNLKN